MARRFAQLIALGAAAIATAPAARAATMQRLTVESFTLASDAQRPNLGVPFHLVIALRVNGRVTHIENVELPVLAQFELLGDERQTITTVKATQYREAITLVAHNAGAVTIAPALLQAVDARDGRPKQWYTNAVNLSVDGGTTALPLSGRLPETAATAIRLLLWIVAAGCTLGIVLVRLKRRPRTPWPATARSQAQSQPAAVTRTRRQQVDDAILVLRAERSRTTAIRVRAAIWRSIGASEGATLGDVLRRPQSQDGALRGLLIALERSAFTSDEDLAAAIDDACSALERYAETLQ